MAIVTESFLNKNDLRNYPFTDRAEPVHTNGLVDFHISILGVADSNRVYVSRLVVSDNLGLVEISYEGAGVIANIEVVNPDPYRVYVLSTGADTTHGFVIFGGAASDAKASIEESYTPDQGELLASLTNFYQLGSVSKVFANGVTLDGDITFESTDTVICEVKSIYYEDEGQSYESMVISLAEDVDTMTRMIPTCKIPMESGLIDDVISTINGVRPDNANTITLVLDSEFDFEYDDDGFIKIENGIPVESDTPLLEWVSNPDAKVLSMVDNLDYKKTCASKKRVIRYQEARCRYCEAPRLTFDHEAPDNNDRPLISYSGVYVIGQRLIITWNYFGTGEPLDGGVGATLTVTLNGDGPPVTVQGIGAIGGTAPKLPGDLIPCNEEGESLGTAGETVYCEYFLSRPLSENEEYTVVGSTGLVRDQSLPVNYSIPFETCLKKVKEDEDVSSSSFTDIPSSESSDGINSEVSSQSPISLQSDPSFGDFSSASLVSSESQSTDGGFSSTSSSTETESTDSTPSTDGGISSTSSSSESTPSTDGGISSTSSSTVSETSEQTISSSSADGTESTASSETSSSSGISSGLIAYWPMNEGAGSTAADVVGGADATFTGGTPDWTTGLVGSAVVVGLAPHFNGGLTAPGAPIPNDRDLTVSAFIRLPTYTDLGGVYGLFRHGNAAPSGVGYEVTIERANQSGTVSSTFRAHMSVKSSAPGSLELVTDVNFGQQDYPGINQNILPAADINEWMGDIWIQITIYFDRTNNQILAEINNNGPVLITATDFWDPINPSDDFEIAPTFAGHVDEVRMYDRIISASEIRDYYVTESSSSSSSLSQFDKADLLYWWTAETAEGAAWNQLLDSGPNSYPGVVSFPGQDHVFDPWTGNIGWRRSGAVFTGVPVWASLAPIESIVAPSPKVHLKYVVFRMLNPVGSGSATDGVYFMGGDGFTSSSDRWFAFNSLTRRLFINDGTTNSRVLTDSELQQGVVVACSYEEFNEVTSPASMWFMTAAGGVPEQITGTLGAFTYDHALEVNTGDENWLFFEVALHERNSPHVWGVGTEIPDTVTYLWNKWFSSRETSSSSLSVTFTSSSSSSSSNSDIDLSQSSISSSSSTDSSSNSTDSSDSSEVTSESSVSSSSSPSSDTSDQSTGSSPSSGSSLSTDSGDVSSVSSPSTDSTQSTDSTEVSTDSTPSSEVTSDSSPSSELTSDSTPSTDSTQSTDSSVTSDTSSSSSDSTLSTETSSTSSSSVVSSSSSQTGDTQFILTRGGDRIVTRALDPILYR